MQSRFEDLNECLGRSVAQILNGCEHLSFQIGYFKNYTSSYLKNRLLKFASRDTSIFQPPFSVAFQTLKT